MNKGENKSTGGGVELVSDLRLGHRWWSKIVGWCRINTMFFCFCFFLSIVAMHSLRLKLCSVKYIVQWSAARTWGVVLEIRVV